MKKGPRIALFVFNILSALLDFAYAFVMLFAGLFSEVLIAVVIGVASSATGTTATTEATVMPKIIPSAMMSIIVGLLVIAGAIISLIFKRNKSLNIAGGIIMSLSALLMLISTIVLVINLISIRGDSNDNVAVYIVIGVIALIHVALYVLTALFSNFLHLKKKEEVVNA